ncbi:MAG TPA: GAF and ANTAR domain-containing protein [Acidimicrobiales bacterium]|nr:GAF and ANTAR domain-containing protein [Acidimicrobiales bacterium]
MARESVLIRTIVELADNLVDNFDVIDLLTMLSYRCADVLDVGAAGVMLSAPGGELQFVASSSESMTVLELFQIQAKEGPCVDCYATGEAVVSEQLTDPDERWPHFSPRALAQGFNAVYCLPMHLRGRTIGALNLFSNRQGPFLPDDVVLAQGLADVATIAILQHRTSLDASMLNGQLSHALNSRIVIEQAKGMIGQTLDCDMNESFRALRNFSRNRNLGLTLVAGQIVARELLVSDLIAKSE